jgi:hypothetical protein
MIGSCEVEALDFIEGNGKKGKAFKMVEDGGSFFA